MQENEGSNQRDLSSLAAHIRGYIFSHCGSIGDTTKTNVTWRGEI